MKFQTFLSAFMFVSAGCSTVRIATDFSRHPSSLQCPENVSLEGPEFLAGSRFPTEDQIRTNFKHLLIKDGMEVFDSEDVSSTTNFVNTLQRQYQADAKLTLTLSINDLGCYGKLEGYTYSFNPNLEEIVFHLPTQDGVERDSVHVRVGKKSPVEVQLALPVNCSDCPNSAELFQYAEVSRGN